MRINKYLASCELGSRRKVEELILSGKIEVNGKILDSLSYDVKESDVVKYNGKVIHLQENKVYIMLNKPRCYITSLKDEKDRKVVTDLLKNLRVKVFPVGRLDYNTQGLLLLTNDGDWANKIVHPSNHIYKTYEAKLKVVLTGKELNQIRKGMIIDDVNYLPAKIEQVSSDDEYNYYNITIMEGKNREIRRIFEFFKVKIYALKRISIGELQLADLQEGKYRYLSETEKNLVFER